MSVSLSAWALDTLDDAFADQLKKRFEAFCLANLDPRDKGDALTQFTKAMADLKNDYGRAKKVVIDTFGGAQ